LSPLGYWKFNNGDRSLAVGKNFSGCFQIPEIVTKISKQKLLPEKRSNCVSLVSRQEDFSTIFNLLVKTK
jgi:hypothetical protein